MDAYSVIFNCLCVWGVVFAIVSTYKIVKLVTRRTSNNIIYDSDIYHNSGGDT